MQDYKQDFSQNYSKRPTLYALPAALLLAIMGLALQGCQTYQLTPEQWNARTNAVNAFSNSAYLYQQSQRPTYGPATPYRPPAQANPFVQNQPQAQQEAPLFGQGSLFGQ